MVASIEDRLDQGLFSPGVSGGRKPAPGVIWLND
jgi:hypothetical protein